MNGDPVPSVGDECFAEAIAAVGHILPVCPGHGSRAEWWSTVRGRRVGGSPSARKDLEKEI